jgi:signal transduction histidine kinase
MTRRIGTSDAALATLAFASLAMLLALRPLGAVAPFAAGIGRWIEHGVAVAFIAGGLIAWRRRPESWSGAVLVVVGVLWWFHLFVLSGSPVLFTAGLVFGLLWLPVFGYAVLAFPAEGLRSGWDRLAVGLLALSWLIDAGYTVVFDPAAFGCTTCPDNMLLIEPASLALKDDVHPWVILAGLVATVAALAIRYARATPVARRVVGPLYIPTIVWAFAYGLYLHLPRVRNTDFLAGDNVDTILLHIFGIALVAIPVTFLLGIRRAHGRLARVSTLVREIGTTPTVAQIEQSLRQTLGDSSLRLGVVRDGDFVDADLQPLDLPPADDPARAVTYLPNEAEAVAVLCHDRALLFDDRELIEAVGSATKLAVHNDQLQDEVRMHLEELRASRSRVVQAADAARREVERNIHDGTQQKLLSLLVGLRLTEIRLGDDADPQLRASLAEMADQLNGAIDELRDLARGVHPAILVEEGLAAGLVSLAERSPVPVVLEAVPEERLPTDIEVTAYYIVSEGIANAAKHGAASEVRVHAGLVDGSLDVRVSDDGRGGAVVGAGSGLRGLADRVETVGGRFRVLSPVGGGTTLTAVIPATLTAQTDAPSGSDSERR